MTAQQDIASAERLRALRLNRGLTVAEAAAAAGVAPSTLHSLEKGSVPRSRTARAVAAFYGTSPAAIWMPGVLPITAGATAPMEAILNPTSISGQNALGAVSYRPADTDDLRLNMRRSTWDLLVPACDRADVDRADRARRTKLYVEPVKDPTRTQAIAVLLRAAFVYGDVARVFVPRGSRSIFLDLFRDLLARVRSTDAIEVGHETTVFNPWRDEQQVIPAPTTPSGPIRDELEAFVAVLPWLAEGEPATQVAA